MFVFLFFGEISRTPEDDLRAIFFKSNQNAHLWPRMPYSNHDSIDEKELLVKADTKCQDFYESKMLGFAQYDQKRLT